MSIMYEDLILEELRGIREELHAIAENTKSPRIGVDGDKLKKACESDRKMNGFTFD